MTSSKLINTYKLISISKLLAIFVLFHMIKCEFNKTKTLDLVYSSIFSLLNGNIFIISKNKAIIYDSSLSQEKYSFDFSSKVNITSKNDLALVSLCEFSQEDDSEYIITIIIKYIFIFDLKTNNYFFIDEITQSSLGWYTLVAYEKNANNYKFIIGKLGTGNLVNATYYQINSETKEISTLKSFLFEAENSSGSYKKVFYGVTCIVMKYSNPTKILTCFYIISASLEFSTLSFDPNEDFKIINVGNNSYYKVNSYSSSGLNYHQ